MPSAPEKGARYDEYEPEKYDCISVDDDYLESIISKLDGIDFFLHTLDAPAKGIAYCGITLIPPESMQDFIAVIDGINGLHELKMLMHRAYGEGKWIIHFGI